MKNIIALVPLTAIFATGVYAYAADDSVQGTTVVKNNGGYNSTTSESGTTDTGTYQHLSTKDNVDVDSNGNVTRKLKVTSTKDPKGLMNKKTYSGAMDYKEKDDGGYKKSVREDSTDAAGTNYSTSSKTNVDVDSQGNVTKTNTSEQVVDPKGFMNKTKTVTTTKSVNGKVVEDTKKAE